MPETTGLPPRFIRKLRLSIVQSNARLRAFKDNRRRALEKFAGAHYGDSSLTAKQPLNMLYTGASVYAPQLVSNYPRVDVRTRIREFRPYAYSLELSTNQTLREIQFRKTLKTCVYDALFGIAFIKCGLFDKDQVEIANELHVVTGKFADRVSLDDFGMDPVADDWEEAVWRGNQYQLPIWYIQESGLFANAASVKATDQAITSDEAARRISKLSETSEIEDYAKLWDIDLPDEKLVITIEAEGESDQPLRVVPYEDESPYDYLGFVPMLDNPMPLPPVANWIDLHDMINVLARKMTLRVEQMKKFGIYNRSNEEDAERVRKVHDGEMIGLDGIENVAEMELGSVGPEMVNVIQWLVGMTAREQGNVDLLGGMAAKTRSATEAAILNANAGVRIVDMRTEVEDFARRIYERLAYYEHTDPLMSRRVIKKIPGTPIEIPVLVTPEYRQGAFLDYFFEFVPYSMAPRDPEAQAQKTIMWFTQIVLPSIQFAMLQGVNIDVPAITRYIADQMGLDEVDEFYIPAEAAAGSTGAGEDMWGQNFIGGGMNGAGQSDITAQLIGQKMPGENAGQAPSNMSGEALTALAGA